jgi:DNA-binding NarL/FixJ family response regulator
LIDDHEILRDGLKCRLQQEPDMEIVGMAASSLEAYACIERTRPSLVIMDVNHPGENGLIATVKIRLADPRVRILILTGDPNAATAQVAITAGANGFLRKVDGSGELVRAVRVVMSGKIYLSPDAATAITQALLAKPALAREPALSERELSVLKSLADGMTYKEIAGQLAVSSKTVETYRARLAKKTGCATLAELVRYAVRKGIIVP